MPYSLQKAYVKWDSGWEPSIHFLIEEEQFNIFHSRWLDAAHVCQSGADEAQSQSCQF